MLTPNSSNESGLPRKSCFFVAGIHGVGKTTLCTAASTALKLPHYSASDLIKRSSQADNGLYKEVHNVAGNQDVLIRSIALHVKSFPYLLDGHFVIRSKTSGMTEIATKVFEDLQLAAIVLVTADPHKITKRLEKRDAGVLNYDILTEMQFSETKRAREVAKTLGVDLCELAHPSQSEFVACLDQLVIKSCG